ncbi:hypothetical protein HPB50_018187 [Hyalomma asiaticum]|uniref:Uncharacterized protein n=1 Tax=Hyalomma asiaticum TaxID=266040 RepID=A0ACB7S121_HYAAI|nr:hypothetical protein HPB50_018187 [Hyalomma asiaticum]
MEKPAGDNKAEKSPGCDQQPHKKRHHHQPQHPMMRAKKIADKHEKHRDKRKDGNAAAEDVNASRVGSIPMVYVKPVYVCGIKNAESGTPICMHQSVHKRPVHEAFFFLSSFQSPSKQTPEKQGESDQQENQQVSPPARSVAPTKTAMVAIVALSSLSSLLVLTSALIIVNWLRAPTELEGKANESALPIAQHYYQSCTAKRSQDSLQSEIQKFAQFKRDVGLLWPEEWPKKSNSSVPPLKLLINLTLNWNINLLFNLHIMPGYKGRPRALFILRGVIDSSWAVYEYEKIKQSIEEHCHYLGAHAPTPALLKVVLDGYLAVVNATLSFKPDAREEEKTTLKEIDERTASARDKWKQYLNEVYSDLDWRLEDVVLVQHPAILDKVGDLLESTSEESLWVGIAWLFLRMNLWTIVGKPHLLFEGSAAEVEAKAKLACLTHVADTFGLVVSNGHLRARFQDDVRTLLSSVFEDIKAQYQKNFADAKWIDESVKTKASAKMSESLDLDCMPSSQFFSNFTITAMYKDFPKVGGSFFDNFVNIINARLRDYLSKKLGDGHVATSYSYYYNSVYFAVGALEPPLFHLDNTFASTYGSLATLMAISVARAFDERGIAYDKGEESPWWTAGHEEYEKRVKCDLKPGSSRSGSDNRATPLFLSVLALRTSYDAYRSAIARIKVVDIYRLKGLEEYTDDQVFFMSYCLMTCAVDSNGDACNVPIRQSSKFATAFKCSEGAPMNPTKRCPFF